jgi:hypothetical protein
MDPIVHAVVSRYQKIARTETLDKAWIDKMRADFLVLMKNLPRIQDYDTADRVRRAMVVYAENFKKLVFDGLLFKAKERRLPVSLEMARKVAWDFYLEFRLPLNLADDYYTADSRFDQFLHEKDAWEKKIKDKAQKCWKALRNAVESQETNAPNEPLSVEFPDEQRVSLEGFKVVLVGYNPDDEWQATVFEKFKASLKTFRARATQVCPWMLKHEIPIKADFVNCELDKGGHYSQGIMTFCMLTLTGEGVNHGVAVLAHEMGHYLYKHLSGKAQEFWETAIKQDYGPLDLEDLLRVWPKSITYYDEFVTYMALKDPVLALQVDVLGMSASKGPNSDLGKREDFQEVLDSGETTLRVPKHPITAYAGKNAEEAFCEVLRNLVAYGPSTVLDEVKRWLNLVIPGTIKMASEYRMAVQKALVPSNPHEHYLVKCSFCGTVLNQCRCRGPKTIISTICDSCKGQATSPI